jgi:hypothetical protein
VLPDDLAQEFARRGYTWKIDGKDTIPSAKDISQTLDKMKETLYARPVPSQMELAHLIVQHWKHGHFDIYLQIGTHND